MSPPPSERLIEAYADAVARERAASALTLELDREADAIQTRLRAKGTKREAALVSPAAELRLLEADRALNDALRALYTGAAGLGPSAATDIRLRTALVHWTVLLRRHLMHGLHTAVPGLDKDPDCAGDLIGDQLFQRYFDALFARRDVDAVGALTALARQIACLGTQQSAVLASQMTRSFDELRAFLRLNGQEELVPLLVQALSEPFLLFYDVEKYRGPESPLARWFREYRDLLMRGVDSGRHPGKWLGLWLYDRRLGRLIGYRHADRPRDENDVDLRRLFASITNRENLGDYSCSFVDMVERGSSALGYICGAVMCQLGGQTARATTGGNAATPAITGPGRELQSVAEMMGATNACTVEPDEVPGSERGRMCGGEFHAGDARASATIQCVTAQIVRPGTEYFSCFLEATGLCSNPVGQLTKALTEQPLAGLKLGTECNLRAGGGGKDAGSDLANRQQQEREWREQHIKNMEQSQKEWAALIARELAALREAEKAAKDAKDAADKAEREKGADDPETQKLKQEQATREAQKKLLDTMVKKDTGKAANEADDLEKEKEKQSADGGSGDKKRCPLDTPDCGDNSCSAMSEQARQTLACLKRTTSDDGPPTMPPRGTPGDDHTRVCRPEACDPVEPGGPTGRGAACLATLDTSAGASDSKACWLVRCPPGQVGTGGPQAGCTCQDSGAIPSGGAPGVRDVCAAMRCAEGDPTYRDGRCTCGASELPSTGGGERTVVGTATFSGSREPVGPGPFVPSTPASFSEVRHAFPY